MSKATHTTTSRSNGRRSQSEISRLAGEITRLQQLTTDIDCKGATDDCTDDETLPADEPHLSNGYLRHAFFKMISREANDRLDVLEETASLLEPETLDDVLTLTVLLGAELNTFSEKYTDNAFEDLSYKDQRQFEGNESRIERLHNAIIRGLMKFASSPLVSAGYLREFLDTIPWSEQLAYSEGELAKLPRKRGKDRDPPNSATQH